MYTNNFDLEMKHADICKMWDQCKILADKVNLELNATIDSFELAGMCFNDIGNLHKALMLLNMYIEENDNGN